MRSRFSNRQAPRRSIVCSLALVVVLATLAAAQPAAPEAQVQQCRGTLILERVTVVSDTDPNPPWTYIDQWTYHIYAWQNGKLASDQNYRFAGDTGYVQQTNTTGDGDNVVANSVLIGNAGDPAELKLELWVKEKDPESNARGASPADQRNNQNPFRLQPPRTTTCVSGVDSFSVVVDIPLNRTNPDLAEHDGQVKFDWKWTLEVL